MINNSWIDRTKDLMALQGVSPFALAEKLQVSPSLIYFYLKNTRKPPLTKIYEIADALHVSPAYLLFGGDLNSPQLLSVIDWQSLNSTECKRIDKPDSPILLKPPYVAYRVYDDSMSPQDAATIGLYIDSIAIVDPQREYTDNSIIVAKLDDATAPLIRQYIERYGSTYLKPINYRFRTINLADHPNFRSLGVVVGNYMG